MAYLFNFFNDFNINFNTNSLIEENFAIINSSYKLMELDNNKFLI